MKNSINAQESHPDLPLHALIAGFLNKLDDCACNKI
jgi:hypothetical protein